MSHKSVIIKTIRNGIERFEVGKDGVTVININQYFVQIICDDASEVFPFSSIESFKTVEMEPYDEK